MELTFTSDTHGRHNELDLGSGQVLCHTGDFSNFGSEKEFADFTEWFACQDFEYKIFICGNHERFGESVGAQYIRDNYLSGGVIYLENSGVWLEDKYFYGSPANPRFFNWAFNVDRGIDIKKYWDLIPSYTNVLLTHTPPFGILDSVKGLRVGCQDLLETIQSGRLENLQTNAFGHIHEDYGMVEREGIIYINSALKGLFKLREPIKIII